ncbi:MAG: hypothetical protein ACKORA_01080, partial [Solirubrobacterales bacterium]
WSRASSWVGAKTRAWSSATESVLIEPASLACLTHPDRARKRIRFDSVALLHALVFAPTQELARLHLAGLLDRPLSEYREDLGRAAWSSVGPDSDRG